MGQPEGYVSEHSLSLAQNDYLVANLPNLAEPG